MVKNHSDSERRNLLPPHRLLFPISSKGSFICIIPQTGKYGLCYTSPGALVGMRLTHKEILLQNENKLKRKLSLKSHVYL